MVSLEKNIALQQRQLDLIILEQHVLTDRLDRVPLPIRGKDCEVYAPECAATNLKLNLEILELDVCNGAAALAQLVRGAHIGGKCRLFSRILNRSSSRFCGVSFITEVHSVVVGDGETAYLTG